MIWEDKQVEGMINVFSLIFEGLGKWFWIFPFLPFFFLLTGLGGEGVAKRMWINRIGRERSNWIKRRRCWHTNRQDRDHHHYQRTIIRFIHALALLVGGWILLRDWPDDNRLYDWWWWRRRIRREVDWNCSWQISTRLRTCAEMDVNDIDPRLWVRGEGRRWLARRGK